MNTNSPVSLESNFSKDAICQQLERICLTPLFKNSEILKKFLLFIVDQTLLGHSNCLKEYTIGVKVLGKPLDFKPQENGIVRIHAGRLRRALNHYYDNEGATDALRITIPKGGYIPVFNEKQIGESHNNRVMQDKPIVIAVIPFRRVYSDPLENLMAEGLCWQMTTRLMRLPNFLVIAYRTTLDLFEKNIDIITTASTVGAEYIVTGSIQSVENHGRVYVQLIHMSNNQQVWSRMFEKQFDAESIFEFQDEIVKLVISELNGLKNLMNQGLNAESKMAIA